jgi:two-component system, LuxR family, sensor kinase FixL
MMPVRAKNVRTSPPRMISDVKHPGASWLFRIPLFIVFIAVYIAIEVASFIHPLHGLNITPWNPAPALGLVLVLRLGRVAWLPFAAAVLLSELAVRGVSAMPLASILSALIVSSGYLILATVLARRLPRDTLLDDRRSLFTWLALVAVGSLAVTCVYLFSLRVLGLLPRSGWWIGLERFWVGDVVGISVLMPLLWWLSCEQGRRLLWRAVANLESVGYLMLALLSLWVAFGVGGHNGFKLFYLLFLPIVWAAARQGMAGAIVCAAFLQVGVIVAMQTMHFSAVSVEELQLLALAMALVGFFVGVVVDEQQRTGEELRRSLRLAAAGEMAGALANELSQPLTALAAYSGACEQLLERGEGEQLKVAVQCVQRESGRATEVLRRLRDFFNSGTPRLESIPLEELVELAVGPYRSQAERSGIRLKTGHMPEVNLLVDRLQMEVVLRNLLSNAFDAVSESPRQPRRIWVAAELESNGRICLRVEDSGQGLSARHAARIFEPFQTTKSSGLGLGLAVSRAIVDLHGGRLWGEVANHGVFKIELPVADADTVPPGPV